MTLRSQLADDLEEGTQRDRVVDIRNSLAYLIEGLRQNGSAQTLLTKTQLDKNKCSVAYVGSQLRRQRGAHIGHRCECRHDQRDRRHHLPRLAFVLPGRTHGQRTFAQRNGTVQLLTQLTNAGSRLSERRGRNNDVST